MLAHARDKAGVFGVVGWVPLADAKRAAPYLDEFHVDPRFRGVRHVLADEADDWLASPEVRDGVSLLHERRLIFEVGTARPADLRHVADLAEQFPALTIVLEHLATPPIRWGGWEPWATLLAEAADAPNVSAKVSGLATRCPERRWATADLQSYVEYARRCFGIDRLMVGSDWPAASRAGTYGRVWTSHVAAFGDLSSDARAAIVGGNAARLYGLHAGESVDERKPKRYVGSSS